MKPVRDLRSRPERLRGRLVGIPDDVVTPALRPLLPGGLVPEQPAKVALLGHNVPRRLAECLERVQEAGAGLRQGFGGKLEASSPSGMGQVAGMKNWRLAGEGDE